MRLIRANSGLGGFEFMDPPGAGYYRDVAKRIPSLTPDQVEQLEVCSPLLEGHHDAVCFFFVSACFTRPARTEPARPELGWQTYCHGTIYYFSCAGRCYGVAGGARGALVYPTAVLTFRAIILDLYYFVCGAVPLIVSVTGGGGGLFDARYALVSYCHRENKMTNTWRSLVFIPHHAPRSEIIVFWLGTVVWLMYAGHGAIDVFVSRV